MTQTTQVKTYPDWMLDSIQRYKTALTGGAPADNFRHCLCREFDKWGECSHTDYLIKIKEGKSA